MIVQSPRQFKLVDKTSVQLSLSCLDARNSSACVYSTVSFLVHSPLVARALEALDDM